jgi:inorganic pyrophosphatase
MTASQAPMHRATPVLICVDTPLGGFVKRGDDGSIDYVSPLPCPFNYGHVPAQRSEDGDALDAVLLGPRHGVGTRVDARAWAVVDFVDDGYADPKLVCGPTSPTRGQQLRVRAFFQVYARLKRWLNLARGRRGITEMRGWRWLEGDAAGSDTPHTRSRG